VLRGLEDALMAGARTSLVATTTSSVAIYILNNKRHFINDMEARDGISITVQASDKLQGANFVIERGHAPPSAARRPERTAVNMDWGFEGEGAEAPEGEPESDRDEPERARESASEARPRDEGRDDGSRRRRRRRGRRGEGMRGESRGADRASEGEVIEVNGEFSEITAGGSTPDAEQTGDDEAPGEEVFGDAGPSHRDDDQGARRRRRGRRGGRRGRDRSRSPQPADQAGDEAGGDLAAEDRPTRSGGARETSDAPPRQPHGEPAVSLEMNAAAAGARVTGASTPEVAATAPAAESAPRPRSRARSQPTFSEPRIERVVVKPDQAEAGVGPEPASAASEPARRGWWQRRLGGE
jgi:ribonuclease E